MLEAKGNNRVAMVAFSGVIQANTDFSSDYATLEKQIDDLGLASGTDIYLALSTAKTSLDEKSSSDAIKNIVFLTDGEPYGKESVKDGKRYKEFKNIPGVNHLSIESANAVFDFYESNIKDSYNMYTMGFFHSFSEERKQYPRQFLKDINNKGYYEVINGEELLFAFGEISQGITVDNTACPIIIVPGIMGSRLYSKYSSLRDIENIV
ncbi:MAG: vWA domain-containing protein [Johnsonella sp.]|nr:vWA domain-containing protein [Johnsonella sp.]